MSLEEYINLSDRDLARLYAALSMALVITSFNGEDVDEWWDRIWKREMQSGSSVE